MKRNTLQRPATLEAVQKLKCHATAEQVYAAIVTQYPTISRGTVYRNLNQLVASGDIRIGGFRRYESFRSSMSWLLLRKMPKMRTVF